MYFSEFTIKLIEEVKKHEILYNTKYEKRPKAEKEEAWSSIASALNDTPDKCKKHWKNVRDRYVKVKHMRDKHFQRGGTELDAPAKYIYFEHLEFMREFSLRKDILVDNTEIVATPSVSPERLLFEVGKGSEPNVMIFDYTSQFIETVKEHQELYDEHSELRRYRSKDTWKRISKELEEKFTVGQLRHYWIQLMKKYRVYLENYHKFHGLLENEDIFDQLSFANFGISMKSEQSGDFSACMQEQIIDEEHLAMEELEDEETSDFEVEMDENTSWMSDLESKKRKRQSESEPEQEPKKQIVLVDAFSEPALEKPEEASSSNAPEQQQDEFYHYGKKIAIELSSLFRELAKKDRDLAIKGEMEVLQLILKLREGLKS